jgi:hypothetical protein
LEAGIKTSASYTVEQAVSEWLNQGLKGRDPGSVDTYRSLAKGHVVADLGRAKLRDLTADALDFWLDEKSLILATSSLQMVFSILKRSITHAQRRQLSPPCRVPGSTPTLPSRCSLGFGPKK